MILFFAHLFNNLMLLRASARKRYCAVDSARNIWRDRALVHCLFAFYLLPVQVRMIALPAPLATG